MDLIRYLIGREFSCFRDNRLFALLYSSCSNFEVNEVMAKVQSTSDNTELRLNETSVYLVFSFYILLTLKRASHLLNRLTPLLHGILLYGIPKQHPSTRWKNTAIKKQFWQKQKGRRKKETCILCPLNEIDEPTPKTCHNYDPFVNWLGLLTLRQRKFMSDLTFIYKIMNNRINCSDIPSLIKFNVPSTTFRSHPPFHSTLHSTISALNNCLDRICKQANPFARKLDFFGGSLPSFKTPAKSALHVFRSSSRFAPHSIYTCFVFSCSRIPVRALFPLTSLYQV